MSDPTPSDALDTRERLAIALGFASPVVGPGAWCVFLTVLGAALQDEFKGALVIDTGQRVRQIHVYLGIGGLVLALGLVLLSLFLGLRARRERLAAGRAVKQVEWGITAAWGGLLLTVVPFGFVCAA